MRPVLVDPVSKIAVAYWDFEHGAYFFGLGWLKRNPNSETDSTFVDDWKKDPYKKVEPPKGNIKCVQTIPQKKALTLGYF